MATTAATPSIKVHVGLGFRITLLHWIHSLLPHVPRYGYLLVFVIVFLNNIGLPLPGEMILLGAGFMMGRTAGSLWPAVISGTAASFVGGICAFWLGHRLGEGGLDRIRWLHLSAKWLKWPQRYFEHHGAKTVLLARFIAIFPPIAANLLAGMTNMSWRTFLVYNLSGSALFSAGYIWLGALVGRHWQLLQMWMGPRALYIILAVIALAVPAVMLRRVLFDLAARLLKKFA